MLALVCGAAIACSPETTPSGPLSGEPSQSVAGSASAAGATSSLGGSSPGGGGSGGALAAQAGSNSTAGAAGANPAGGAAGAASAGAAGMTGMAGGSAGGGPLPACGAALPPSDGLELWLKSGTGITESGGKVSSWADQSHHQDVTQGDGNLQPHVEANAINGKTALQYYPGDVLQRKLAVDGLEGLTVAIVSATPTLWKAGNEWCQDSDCCEMRPPNGQGRLVTETGCSGSYQYVLDWKGNGNNGGVSMSPKQEEIAYRIGVNADTGNYSENTCKIPVDPLISAKRPMSRGTGFSLDVLVHDGPRTHMFQDGQSILDVEKPKSGGVVASKIANTGDDLFVGSEPGWVHRSPQGDKVAEVLVYKRALGNDERQVLERYLNCEFFPDRVKP